MLQLWQDRPLGIRVQIQERAVAGQRKSYPKRNKPVPPCLNSIEDCQEKQISSKNKEEGRSSTLPAPQESLKKLALAYRK